MTKLQAWAICCADGALEELCRSAQQAEGVAVELDKRGCGPHTVVELGAVEELNALSIANAQEIQRLRSLLSERDHGLCCYHQQCHRCGKSEVEIAATRPNCALPAPPVEKEPESE